MEVYADLFVAVNCLCDGTVVALTALLLKRRVKKRRILLSSLIGGLYAFFYLLLYPAPILLPLLSVITSLLMVFAAFGFHGPLCYIRALLVFYLVSLAAGGLVGAANELLTYLTPSPTFSLLLLLVLLAMLFLFCMTAGQIFLKEQKKKVAILHLTVAGKDYRTEALLDSGNLLTDPLSALPVALLDPNIFDEPPFCDRTVTIQTATDGRDLPAFLPDEAAVDGIRRKICIALCPPPEGGFGGTPALLPILQ